jgi:hypothetical protein
MSRRKLVHFPPSSGLPTQAIVTAMQSKEGESPGNGKGRSAAANPGNGKNTDEENTIARVGSSGLVLIQCCAANQPEDATDRSSRMPRNTALLYPRPGKLPGDAPYGGVMVTVSGRKCWCALWFRLVKGQQVFELKIAPMKEDEP